MEYNIQKIFENYDIPGQKQEYACRIASHDLYVPHQACPNFARELNHKHIKWSIYKLFYSTSWIWRNGARGKK